MLRKHTLRSKLGEMKAAGLVGGVGVGRAWSSSPGSWAGGRLLWLPQGVLSQVKFSRQDAELCYAWVLRAEVPALEYSVGAFPLLGCF